MPKDYSTHGTKPAIFRSVVDHSTNAPWHTKIEYPQGRGVPLLYHINYYTVDITVIPIDGNVEDMMILTQQSKYCCVKKYNSYPNKKHENILNQMSFMDGTILKGSPKL